MSFNSAVHIYKYFGDERGCESATVSKMGTKQVLGNFFKNPPLLIVCTAFLVYGFLNYGRMTAGMYYFTYFGAIQDCFQYMLRLTASFVQFRLSSADTLLNFAEAKEVRCCFATAQVLS